MIDEPDDVAADADEERALRALAVAERLDPPGGLAAGVMHAVTERSRDEARPSGRARVRGNGNPGFWSPDKRRPPSAGGSISSRQLLLGIAAAAVLTIGVFAVKGFPPVGPGSEGTVGAARKYQSEPIAARDVTLQNPETQQVLQSDWFRRLVSNPETRAVLSSRDFQKAMAAAEVQAFFSKAGEDAGLRTLLADVSRDAAFTQLRANGSFQAAMSNPAFTNLFADAAFTKALGDRAFLDGISNAAFLDAAKSGALAAAVDQATDAAAGKDAAHHK